MAERLCRYPPCGCQPEQGEAYCTPECERRDAPSPPDSQECGCGHPECRPRHARRAGRAAPADS